MNGYIIRKASLSDIPFLVDTIIFAEKSGTDHLGLANLFELSELEIRNYLTLALEEEIDGCEFSVSSFIIVEYEGEPVSAFGGWIEGKNEDNLPSSIIKANIVGYIFPRDSVLNSVNKVDIVKSLQIERVADTYQLEYSYTRPDHRGKGLLRRIIEAHTQIAIGAGVKKMQVHVFDNNVSAINAYQKSGFCVVKEFHSDNIHTADYYPSDTELLMEKNI